MNEWVSEGQAYKAQPINTSDVWLDKDINQLSELLAANNHDIWADKLFREGWKRGLQANDERKIHPNLVPYQQLSEQDQYLDLKMAKGDSDPAGMALNEMCCRVSQSTS